MKNTLFDPYPSVRLPRDIQMKRLQRVIRAELTDIQREVLLAYYIQELTLEQIARDRNVNKSTVCRTLHRAERLLKKYLIY